MVLPQFEYSAPKTIGEVCNLSLEFGGTVRVMAGTTDLIPPMKDKIISPEYIVDLKKTPGLDYLEHDNREGLKIGALTTLRTIETSPLVKEEDPAVAHAAKVVASTQIRTEDTMAGNICSASPSCDTTPNLLAQGARALIQGPNKDRVIQIEDFFLGVKETSLEPGEIVTGIAIPPLAENGRAVYIKHAVRKTMDLVIIGVAAKIKVEDGVCIDARIAPGAVAAMSVRAPGAEEALIDKEPIDEVIVKTSEEAMNFCHPIFDIRTSAEYREDTIRMFTKRAIKQAMECYNQEGDRNEAQYKFNHQRRSG